jgi:hypothetical protein
MLVLVLFTTLLAFMSPLEIVPDDGVGDHVNVRISGMERPVKPSSVESKICVHDVVESF